MTTVIIGCGAAKRDLASGQRIEIGSLYTGPLYKARLAYAQALGGPHYVASALHGLVSVHHPVGTYELDLRKSDEGRRRDWTDALLGRLVRYAIPRDHIVALVAGPYADWVPLARRAGYTVDVPAAGLELGPSISLLRAMARTAAEARS